MRGSEGVGRDNRGDENGFVFRVAPRRGGSTSYGKYCVALWNIIVVGLMLFVLGSHVYVLYKTWHETFSGVWVVRVNIALLIVVYLLVVLASFSKPNNNQVPPSCLSIQYLKYRWPIWTLAFSALASIPVLYVAQKNAISALFFVLKSQIEYCLFTVIFFVVIDSINRYLYQRQLEEASEQRPVSPAPQSSNAQFGYFSPKSKNGAPPLTSQKSPFDSGKFHYAR